VVILDSRRRNYLARLSIFLIMVALITGMAGCDGCTPSQKLEIRDWYDLDAIRNNLEGHYRLMNDLDSTSPGYTELASPTANEGKGWQPVGTLEASFSGTFDGQGYEIHDLFINYPYEYSATLFVWVGEGGVIKNLGVVNATATGYEAVSGLVGWNEGTVSNSYSTGSITGVAWVGGLVGGNAGTVSNSYSTGSVTGDYNAGGLVGVNSGTVSSSYSTASVTGEMCVGGLVAFNNESTLSNSYFTGSVTGDLGVGGLVAFNYESIVSNSYYNYDEVLINGDNIITIGALFGEDFEEWLANDKFLDVNERLSQENGYYLVNNITDFKELLAFGQNCSLKFRLANDLDLGGDPNFYIPYLAGEFDGNGHKISNLSFNFDFVSHVGLFGYLAPGGRVSKVGVDNVNTTGASFVGGLVGTNWEGTVSNCYSTGTVTGSATRSDYSYEESVGGLVGANWEGTVSDSNSIGSVSGKEQVGGLVGDNYQGAVSKSYFNGNVTGVDFVGGLVGWNKVGTVSNSYSTGSVSGSRSVGGLAGQNYGTVSNSYSTGSVNGSRSVGGLVGCNNHGTVSSSYSTGSVTGGTLQVGGLVGWNEIFGTVNNSFWDTETSGQATSDGGTGKTTAQMKSIATFSGAEWDIITVALDVSDLSYTWNIIEGQTYPFLSWEL
jgi:hypothetical protein